MGIKREEVTFLQSGLKPRSSEFKPKTPQYDFYAKRSQVCGVGVIDNVMVFVCFIVFYFSLSGQVVW